MEYGTNGGRLYYDALQLSLRRSTGMLRVSLNYPYSHLLDNMTNEGNGFTTVIDAFTLKLNKARGDFDQPQPSAMGRYADRRLGHRLSAHNTEGYSVHDHLPALHYRGHQHLDQLQRFPRAGFLRPGCLAGQALLGHRTSRGYVPR